MYVPAESRPRDPSDALALMRDYPFATVISVVEGLPVVSYLPCSIVKTDPHIEIRAHFARANSHWKHVEAAGATLLFHGPHGYISPRWYANPSGNVPTWNYAVVHARAVAHLCGDAETRDIVTALADAMEHGAASPWSLAGADEIYVTAQLRGIVGVRFVVQSLESKFKLSQNRSEPDHRGVINGLRDLHRTEARELAQMMEDHSLG